MILLMRHSPTLNWSHTRPRSIVPSKGWGPHTPSYGYTLSKRLLHELNVSTLEELRALPPHVIAWDTQTMNSNSFSGYVYDPRVLDRWPLEAYSMGLLNARGGMIMGHTSKDGTAPFYGVAPLANATPAMWATAMQSRWGANASKVIARYPLDRFSNGTKVSAVAASYVEADADNCMACPMRTMATLASSHQLPVFTYVFSHCHLKCDAGWELKVLPWWLPKSELDGCGWGSHGSDIKFVFGTNHGGDTLVAAPYAVHALLHRATLSAPCAHEPTDRPPRVSQVPAGGLPV